MLDIGDLMCPFCGQSDGQLFVPIRDPDVYCEKCNEYYTPEQIEARVRLLSDGWRVVLAWLKQHPARKDKE